MNKGSKYKSGQRPTFRIWDNEKNDWFKPTYDGWNGKIEELLLSPGGDLTMRTFTDFIHESVFPDRFEIFRDESPITDEQAWNKIAEAYPETAQSLRITLDHAVYGQEAEPQKVKVPAVVAKWISKHYYMGKYVCLERFMCQYNSVELPTDLYNYYDSDKEGARDKVISAILGGYEVEEEPKWVVKQKDGFYIDGLAMIEGKTYAKTFESEAEACKWAELCSGLIEKV